MAISRIPTLIFAAVAGSILSCGTVHQMIPPMPLARNEFRGNLVISYDLDRFAPFTSWGGNLYWGVGDEVNLGFGYQPPFGISHFTGVKYFNSEKSKYENLYASINGILFNIDYSPNLEIGASYIVKDGKSFHSFSSGLWVLIDKDMTEPLWKMIFWRSMANAKFRPRARPFLKYEFSHGDLELSIRNNIGLSRRAIAWNRRQLDLREKIYIPNEDIDHVTFNAVSSQIQINLRNTTIYRITRNYPQVDILTPQSEIDKYRLKRFTREDTIGYYFVVTLKPDLNSAGRRTVRKSGLYEIDYDGILTAYTGKYDIVITSYPERTKDILDRIHWYRHDWSVALGIKTRD